MMDWVLRAYEEDRQLPYPALMVLGPFMPQEQQRELIDRAERLDGRVHVITFDSRIEGLMARRAAIGAMGGYKHICEILSFRLEDRAVGKECVSTGRVRWSRVH